MLYKIQRKNIYNRILAKGENSLHDFWQKSQREINETKEAEKVFVKYMKGIEVTAIEKEAFKTQTFDLMKILFIGVPLAIVPGFSVIMIVIVRVGRKYNFNVLPSSFAPQKKEV